MHPTLMKWLIRVGVLVILALVVLSVVRSKPFGFMMLERTISRLAHQDTLGDLPDGLHVLLCGAGGPLADTSRSGPCVAVQAGERLYIIDAGTNGARNLARFGVNSGTIDAVLITHAHSDHIDGLGELAVQRWVGGNHTQPLPVYGPPVVSEVVAGFNLAYTADADYRTAHHGEAVVPSSGAGLSAMPFALPEDGESHLVLETEDSPPVRITAFRVSHEPVSEAVGYRVDYGERSLVVSGDTSKSANLIAHAKGVDLLLHDALDSKITQKIAEVMEANGAVGPAKIMRDVPSYHATPVEAAESAKEAGAKHLVLYHIVPPLPLDALERVYMSGVARVYDGPVTLASDGLLLSAGNE